ncbi:Tryptophan 2-halogenase [Purpureocillium lavendulum]|uniref:Tryptophan 2-halogenase n=1 Tax=Purpureocillium lavendulum TaxID=1247861 RepID=A0AB34FJZ5_9HYPO|nr:Tryptophan 2-halogenase [Purpureocillium lavendulum]
MSIPPQPRNLMSSKGDLRLYQNITVPSSVFICGSQGSGKSHTLGCMLENCLIPSDANRLPRPLKGIVFHYDSFTSDAGGAPCEAAYLSSHPDIKRIYRTLPNVHLEELHFDEGDLNTKRVLDLMAVSSVQGGRIPLYMHVVTRILRQLRIMQQKSNTTFKYRDFKHVPNSEDFLAPTVNTAAISGSAAVITAAAMASTTTKEDSPTAAAPLLGPVSTASSSPGYVTSVAKIAGRASVPDEASSNPHHVVGRGGGVSHFKNPYPSWSNPPGFLSMFRNVLWPLLTGDLKQPDTSPPTVPVVTPQWLPERFAETSSSSSASGAGSKLRATWLGHACYYVEFPSGLRVLFDPRYTPRPCNIADIPAIDAVVISHSHYDHLSHTSVLEIQRSHPDVQFFVGLGLEKWFRKSGLKNVTELDWWEDAELTVQVAAAKGAATAGDSEPAAVNGIKNHNNNANSNNDKGPMRSISARVSCLPCQHTSARSLLDKDTTLWCSWGVKSGGKSVWFGGDTGYRAVPRLPRGVDDWGAEYEALPRCPQFKQIGDLRGPFDLGLIPIGAYYPRAAFSAMHANPFDSVEIFRDTRCARAMGIHWGTWALTMEEVLEPPRVLREALKRRGLPETGVFDVCDIGESREF